MNSGRFTVGGKLLLRRISYSVLGHENSRRLLSLQRHASSRLRRPRITLFRKLFPPNPANRYLNIGGGEWYYRGWDNIDFYVDQYFIDYKIDMRLQTPVNIPDGCASLIFCSHVLEHFSDDVALFTLRECHRLLKPQGTVRLSVPDMDVAFEAYRSNDNVFFDRGGVGCVGDSIERKLVNFFASYEKDNYSGGPEVHPSTVRNKLKALNKYEFATWCVGLIPEDAPYKAHVNGFDFSKLLLFLEKAGFSRIERSAYRSSRIPMLRGQAFDNRPMVSLFVEATK